MALNKKRSLYSNDTDGRALDALSKAALIDIVVAYIRQGDKTTPLSADELAQHASIQGILKLRGDKPLQTAAQIAAKAAKTAKQDALLAERNARLRAEWDAIRDERKRAQRERMCAGTSMSPLSVMADELSAKAEADKKAAAQRARNEAATKKLLAAHHKRVQDAAVAAGADAALADIHAKAFPFRAQRDARKGADAALMEALNSLGNKR